MITLRPFICHDKTNWNTINQTQLKNTRWKPVAFVKKYLKSDCLCSLVSKWSRL